MSIFVSSRVSSVSNIISLLRSADTRLQKAVEKVELHRWANELECAALRNVEQNLLAGFLTFGSASVELARLQGEDLENATEQMEPF